MDWFLYDIDLRHERVNNITKYDKSPIASFGKYRPKYSRMDQVKFVENCV